MIDFEVLDDIKFTIGDILSEKLNLESKLADFIKDKEKTEDDLICAKEAQAILNTVARETQSEIEQHITTIVTMALAAVEVDDPKVPKPPEFVAKMVERRDGTECDLFFKEGDREDYPKESGGYGYQDVADYLLRIDYILLNNEYNDVQIRKTIFADEPFRNADPQLQYKISEMLEMVSNDLGFQQIINSHAKGVNINAETVFEVVKIDGISKVTKKSNHALE